MFTSPYLDLLIGLAVVFFLCSLVVSGLNEGVNWLTRVRSKFLWAYLQDLFDRHGKKALPRGLRGITSLWQPRNDPRPAAGGSPLVTGAVAPAAGDVPSTIDAEQWLSRLAAALNPIDAPQPRVRRTKSGGRAPRTGIKNVPPASLAQAVVETLADAGRHDIELAVRSLLAVRSEADASAASDRLACAVGSSTATRSALREFGLALATAPDTDARAEAVRSAADALAQALCANGGHVAPHFATAWAAAAAKRSATDDQVRAATDELVHARSAEASRVRIENALALVDKSSPIYPTLRRLWESASGELDKFRTGIEQYFDGEMQRLSGYYRRSIRIVTFGLALVVATAGGIDTFAVTRALWRNPDARANLVREADALNNTSSGATPSGQAPEGTLAGIKQRCEAAHPADDATITDPDEFAAAEAKVRACVSDALDHLTGLGIIDHAAWVDPHGWARDWSRGALAHLAGLLLTALALVLGAPFWFDTIKRLTGLRKGLGGDT